MRHAPALMREVQQGVENYAPRQRSRSDRAAQAAADMEALENDNAKLTEQLTNTKNLLQLAEERNAVLQADLLKTKLEAEYHHDRCVTIETKLRTSAGIILDALKPTQPRIEEKTPLPETEMG